MGNQNYEYVLILEFVHENKTKTFAGFMNEAMQKFEETLCLVQ